MLFVERPRQLASNVDLGTLRPALVLVEAHLEGVIAIRDLLSQIASGRHWPELDLERLLRPTTRRRWSARDPRVHDLRLEPPNRDDLALRRERTTNAERDESGEEKLRLHFGPPFAFERPLI